MKLIRNKNTIIGVRIGSVGIGIMRFPWIHTLGRKQSFWTWLINYPTRRMTFRGFAQARFMWLAMQVTR